MMFFQKYSKISKFWVLNNPQNSRIIIGIMLGKPVKIIGVNFKIIIFKIEK